METLNAQLFGISKGLKEHRFDLPDIGDIMPAAFMVQELNGIQPVRCSYMNTWGCEYLGTSKEEINELGDAYYHRYFVKEEIFLNFVGIGNYLASQNFDTQYNFFQRVKLFGKDDFTWFYTVCKLLKVQTKSEPTNKLILLSSPVMGMDNLVSRVNKTLEQNAYVRANYQKFALLTSREKEIITLLAQGKSSKEIAEQLFISHHTVSTHRKHVVYKIGCNSFAELLQFAIAFDLV